MEIKVLAIDILEISTLDNENSGDLTLDTNSEKWDLRSVDFCYNEDINAEH
jgi:hypothetical protein